MIRMRLAAAQVEPRGQRQLMAMIARQVDRDERADRSPRARCIIAQLPSRDPSLTSTSS